MSAFLHGMMTGAGANAANGAEDDEMLVCTTCKLSKPKSDFMKNGRVMKTCSAHRVSKDANSTWAELVRAIKSAKAKGKPLELKKFIMPFEEFQPMSLVTGKDDTRNRSRACKRMLQELHRLTGYRWCFRNTWRLQDSWVAKCSCAQDTSWGELNVFKPKAVTKMGDDNKVTCNSSLTIRIYFASRNFELELAHSEWHKSAIAPPPAGGKKGKGKSSAKSGGDDDDSDDYDERDVQASVGNDPSISMAAVAAAAATGPSRLIGGSPVSGFMPSVRGFGYGAGGFKPGMPNFIPAASSNANSDSYNHCMHLLQRSAVIMNETRNYMLEGNNFGQFRQFFQGVEAFVNAYESQQGSVGGI
ncbi:hypothetical protein K437DRAFT_258680 [Tilletiaria anomala UBC 951]|uniref:Uncharacterized protein n=1 Tax=Tilletiaria anomala (strain ATCC 24038 / CBS 436.72 / UBC 951) TaxID=1037660 RepID=A0A066VFY5_TILAU|nr:uncharacterized protein K437DRAFT_258680 [Tilletiaria anomala UBC 951]KDN40341.1 hypothetical protein K437DRAFT_258680 [Tilletiaria anomala UBC 951]